MPIQHIVIDNINSSVSYEQNYTIPSKSEQLVGSIVAFSILATFVILLIALIIEDYKKKK